jgi:hypothetical protein
MTDIWKAKDTIAARYLQSQWQWQSSVRRRTRRLGIERFARREDADSTRGFAAPPSRIHAVGVGSKNDTDEPAVVVYVTKKLPMDLVPEDERIPETEDGVRTDVVERPMARLLACTDDRMKTIRPLVAGISISRADGPSGTLGAFVRSRRPSDGANSVFLLSNSHILSSGSGAVAGIRVRQPSVDDGGAEFVATVVRATRLTSTVPIKVDAGIAKISSGAVPDNQVCAIGKLTGTSAPLKDSAVRKHGRTSGLTTATVKTLGLTAQVEDTEHNRELTFVDLFLVEPGQDQATPIAEPGDSGSVVVDAGNRVVGLLHAADPGGTFYYAQPFGEVLDALEIDLLV